VHSSRRLQRRPRSSARAHDRHPSGPDSLAEHRLDGVTCTGPAASSNAPTSARGHSAQLASLARCRTSGTFTQ
jgi:hypothetical protein